MTEQRLIEQLTLVFTSAEDVQSSVVGGGAESVVAQGARTPGDGGLDDGGRV